MAERLTPGVYVEEVSGGVRPIQALGTSTCGFIGEAQRGIPDRAQFVNGFRDYVRRFGGHRRGPAGFLAQAVEAFFNAGGRRAYVVRVLPGNAAAAGTPAALVAREEDRWGLTRNVLRFDAKGRGGWADAIRIHIEDGTSFPAEAFRVRVEWTEGGRSRTVEQFDDVRMDPEHEDYAVRLINETSQYLLATDLFQAEFLDAEDREQPPIPEQLPALVSRPNHVNALTNDPEYRIPLGARLQFSWRDLSSARHSDTVDPPRVNFDDETATAAGATIADGAAVYTAAQLAGAVDAALGGDFRVAATGDNVRIEPAVASSAYLAAMAAENGTFDLTTVDAVRVTAQDGAGQNPETYEVTINHPDLDSVTPEAMAALITAAVDAGANPYRVTVEAAGRYLVVRAGPSADGVQLVVDTLAGGNPVPAPWPDPTVINGAPGLDDIDSLNFVEVSVSEVIQPGVARVLAEIFPMARAAGLGENHPGNPALRPALTEDTPVRLLGGSDGSGEVGAAEYRGTETLQGKTGLRAFDAAEINMLAIPGRNSADYLSVGMAYCDRRDVFFVADGVGSTDLEFEITADEVRQMVEGLPTRSNNAAMFYPWVEVPDPVGVGRNPRRLVPPSGHVAGIFARTDVTRGVWKAPAGIEATVNGAVDLQHRLIDADQDLLNPVGLNCIRQFPNVGIVNWGARTLASDPEWRYVPVRRTALFLKESLRRGLQWAVFEPNDVQLWDRIRININAFMLGLFRQGAFQGTTPDEAFLVKCDRETNPQELVDQGIVTARVAFAPLKPAEFVVIEISQKSLLVV
jgi:hypothetical protein